MIDTFNPYEADYEIDAVSLVAETLSCPAYPPEPNTVSDRGTHGNSLAFVYPFLKICELALPPSDSIILTGFL